jgi:flagellin-like protein
MKYRKFRQNKKAISPIISTLLLIAIAVVASLVAYAWVMGYIGFQTAKTGSAIQIQSLTDSKNTLTVYVQNTGQGAVSLNANSVYVNGTLMSTVITSPANGVINPGVTATLTATPPAGFAINSGDQDTVKVTSTGGTYSQVTQALP